MLFFPTCRITGFENTGSFVAEAFHGLEILLEVKGSPAEGKKDGSCLGS